MKLDQSAREENILLYKKYFPSRQGQKLKITRSQPSPTYTLQTQE